MLEVEADRLGDAEVDETGGRSASNSVGKISCSCAVSGSGCSFSFSRGLGRDFGNRPQMRTFCNYLSSGSIVPTLSNESEVDIILPAGHQSVYNDNSFVVLVIDADKD